MTMPPLPKTDTLDISGCFLVWNQRQMLDYAAAVRAATIEECAKVCEDLGPSALRKWAEPDNLDCAAAIRALKLSSRSPMLDPLLTREDLAGYLKVSPRQVDAMHSKLPQPIYIGRLPRWRTSDIAEWVRQQSVSTSEIRAVA